jgi:hypothetical protein
MAVQLAVPGAVLMVCALLMVAFVVMLWRGHDD